MNTKLSGNGAGATSRGQEPQPNWKDIADLRQESFLAFTRQYDLQQSLIKDARDEAARWKLGFWLLAIVFGLVLLVRGCGGIPTRPVDSATQLPY